ncbi:phage tail protein [Elioraea sp.]|uniref:phage tail protein n=1 Tax=Elioraea sp. TaxID=2185103 RepID=UPI0025BC8F9A|nr:phage tail protein [Elioraea sp.]
MAVAVPLVAAVAGAAVSAGAGAVIGGTILGSAFLATAATSIAGGLASFAINAAFAQKAKAPQAAPLASIVAGLTEELVETAQPQAVLIGRLRAAGTLAYVSERPAGSLKNGLLYQVHAMAGHRSNRILEIFLNDEPLSAAKFSALARAEWKLGTPTQGALDLIVSGTGGEWSTDHRGRGCVLVGTELKYDESVWRGSRPIVRALGEWLSEIYDPRTGVTGYSTNPALIVAWFLTARDAAGVPYGFGLPWARIHEPSLIAAANICDEPVTLASGATERRYTCNGSFNRSEPRAEVLGKLLTAMAGDAQPAQDGLWRINAGAWRPPVTTIDADWLADGYEHAPDRPLDELVNVVRATYLRPEANWQVTDAPVIEDLAALAEDDGEEETLDLELPFTTSGFTVQRLMKIALRQNRVQGTLTLPCNLRGLLVVPGETVTVTLPDLETATWRVRELRIGENATGVTLTLDRWEASIFDWSVAEEQPLGNVPGLALPDGAILGAPTVTVTPPAVPVPASVAVAWSAVPGATAYDLDWRLPGATAWTATSQGGTSATITTGDRASFRVRARNAAAEVGNWTDAPFPAALSDWSVTGSAAGYFVTWSGAPRVQVFSSAGSVFASATKVGADLTAPADVSASAGAVNVWLRPISALGVAGAPVGPIAVTAGTGGTGGDGSTGAPGEGGGGGGGEGGGADGGGDGGGE